MKRNRAMPSLFICAMWILYCSIPASAIWLSACDIDYSEEGLKAISREPVGSGKPEVVIYQESKFLSNGSDLCSVDTMVYAFYQNRGADPVSPLNRRRVMVECSEVQGIENVDMKWALSEKKQWEGNLDTWAFDEMEALR